MAEFTEVMRKIRELCAEREVCTGCIMESGAARYCGAKLCEPRLPAEEIERRVAQWEAAKPKYPSWNEVWKQVFPKATCVPCPICNFGAGECVTSCAECRARPIPAEIAEKLGIEPKEADK